MDILNKKQKNIIIIIATFMILFVGVYTINKANSSQYVELEIDEENNIIEEESLENEEKIIIHVTGAVKNQGIVEMKKGLRISDAINAAGGTTEEADLNKINLAYIVEDGQKIYVPSINDSKTIENITKDAGENVFEYNYNKNNKVNINYASQTELETLTGIGPSTALKIINYREQNGCFEKIEDIKNVPGIGEAKFEGLKSEICIE